jgi:hypothetical protein
MALICLKNNFLRIEFDSHSDFVCSHCCFHTSSALSSTLIRRVKRSDGGM